MIHAITRRSLSYTLFVKKVKWEYHFTFVVISSHCMTFVRHGIYRSLDSGTCCIFRLKYNPKGTRHVIPHDSYRATIVHTYRKKGKHYNDVIMGAMASQITSLTSVYSTVYSGAYQRKHQSSASLACAGNSPVTGESPAQMAGNAENVSI